jgi:hypothetical protein
MFENVLKAKLKKEEKGKSRLIKPSKKRVRVEVNKLTSNQWSCGEKSGQYLSRD